MIHPLAQVSSKKIGNDTQIWQFSVILEGAAIGERCNINCHVFIENDVVIGDEVTVKSGVYLWDGITIEDKVFIGPNVSFTNDKLPRSKQYPEAFQRTVIRRGASIGAAAIILGGVEIGEGAMVAAGALVSKSVPARAMVMGQPARITGWVNADGSKMISTGGNTYKDNTGKNWIVMNNELVAK